jgi:hypothetical protein
MVDRLARYHGLTVAVSVVRRFWFFRELLERAYSPKTQTDVIGSHGP